MQNITISGRRVTITDSLRDYVNEKIGGALKVFDIKPMTCDVVLRVDKNRSNPDSQTVEVTVFVRDWVVRVESSHPDMYAAVDEAADKVARQLRKYKTKVIDNYPHVTRRVRDEKPRKMSLEEMDAMLEPLPETEEEDNLELVRVKYIDLEPMSEEQALVRTDLLGHDFFVYIDEVTGLTNVAYKRQNGGYGILKPTIEDQEA